MLRFVLCVLLVIGVFVANSGELCAQVHVRGHFRKDGTYVRSHYRSRPDGNFANNWSTYGNWNPYTGMPGSIRSPRSHGSHVGSVASFQDTRVNIEGFNRNAVREAEVRRRVVREPVVKSDEDQAASFLNMARTLHLHGRTDAANRRLTEVARVYPHTFAGKIASSHCEHSQHVASFDVTTLDSTTAQSMASPATIAPASADRDDEQLAHDRLSLAIQWVKQGRHQAAYDVIEQIVTLYPNTESGRFAQKLRDFADRTGRDLRDWANLPIN